MIVNKTLTFGKLGIIATTIATVGLTLTDLAPANAAFIDLAINGIIESGDLTGATYTGTFSFPEPTNPNFSGEIPLETLSITFVRPPDSVTFTKLSAAPGTVPLVEYSDGALLGLEFSVEGAELGMITFDFSFIPGFPPTPEGSLFYDVENGQGGTGTANIVPEPTTMLASFGILGLIGYHKRRRNR